MAKGLLLQWRPKAWDDLTNHAESIGVRDQEFLDCITETVALLSIHPELGGVFETANPRLIGLRAKLVNEFPRFVVFYRPHVQTIEIVRVLVGGQDMDALIQIEG